MAKVEKKFVIDTYTVRNGIHRETEAMTIAEAVEYFRYTLECGKSYEHEKGNKKINMNPKNIKSLIDNLNKAVNNSAANGYSGKYYSASELIA